MNPITFTLDELPELLDPYDDPANPDDASMRFDNLDEALVGVARQFSSPPLLVYSYAKIIGILMDRDGMSYSEAVEFAEFNILGSYVGRGTPLVMLYEREVESEPDQE